MLYFHQTFFKINVFKKNFYWNIIRVSNGLYSDQDQQVGRMLVLIWVQTVCKGYQHTTKVASSKERVESKHVHFSERKCVILYEGLDGGGGGGVWYLLFIKNLAHYSSH